MRPPLTTKGPAMIFYNDIHQAKSKIINVVLTEEERKERFIAQSIKRHGHAPDEDLLSKFTFGGDGPLANRFPKIVAHLTK